MDIFQEAFTIFAVIAALAAALWTLRKRGLVRFKGAGLINRAPRELQVIERLQLTPQHAICLVRINSRTLLIGTAPSSCNILKLEDTH